MATEIIFLINLHKNYMSRLGLSLTTTGSALSTAGCTVKSLNIRTPEKFAVITLRFEQDGFTEEQCTQMMQPELQTV